MFKKSTTSLPCTGAPTSQSIIKLNITVVRLVPDFRGRFWPIFVQAEEAFFATIVRSLFDEKS